MKPAHCRTEPSLASPTLPSPMLGQAIAYEDLCADFPSPNMGEVRGGEAAFRCETVIARFPHLGLPMLREEEQCLIGPMRLPCPDRGRGMRERDYAPASARPIASIARRVVRPKASFSGSGQDD